jgi:putative membrane protein
MTGFPFCGAPPLPGGATWTLEPLLLAALGVAGLGLAWAGRGAERTARLAALAGWLVLVAALVSPLCNLAVALFGFRVTQHLLITLVAAPLIATALVRADGWQRAGPVPAAATFAALFWLWHLPGPYAASFHPDGIAWWWAHATLALSALWLWIALLAARHARPVAAALAGLFTGLQMGALGALLTFATRPLYVPHGPEVTLPWGLTPLEDQQLGGLLMWVPGGLLLAAVLLATLATMLRTPAAPASDLVAR